MLAIHCLDTRCGVSDALRMPSYRFYFTTDEGRVLRPAVVAECADDPSAIAKTVELAMEALATADPIEIWDGARVVGQVQRNSPTLSATCPSPSLPPPPFLAAAASQFPVRLAATDPVTVAPKTTT